MESSEVTPLERGALLGSRLIEGKTITAREAADLCGVSERTARRDLNCIARVLAIYRDDDWRWHVITYVAEGE